MNSLRTPDYSLWQNFLLLAGRVLMGWIFVESGWRKLMGMDAFIAGLVTRHVPYATVLGWIGAAVEFAGGLALVLGAWTRCGALMLIVFTIVATLIGHRYWEIADAARRTADAAKPFRQEHHHHRRADPAVRHRGRAVFGGWVEEEVGKAFFSLSPQAGRGTTSSNGCEPGEPLR